MALKDCLSQVLIHKPTIDGQEHLTRYTKDFEKYIGMRMPEDKQPDLDSDGTQAGSSIKFIRRYSRADYEREFPDVSLQLSDLDPRSTSLGNSVINVQNDITVHERVM